jgi:alpha-tubulin suppressor-like RCC1 family protein
VVGAHPFRQIDAGAMHTCAVTTEARAFCWGSGRSGQIGNGKTYLSFWPRAVSGGLSVARVSTGLFHTCAETTVKRAYCWGSNSFGQLGSGQAVGTNTTTPVPVAGGLSVAQLSAGNWHTCAKTTSGAGYCWGDDFFAALGNGTSGSFGSSVEPVPVAAPL